MIKKIIIFTGAVFICFAARAQSPSADTVYNKYLDFNLARFQGEQDKAFELGEDILPYADKLPEKARISFYFSIGKIYEDNDEPDKALPFYEKVAAAVPDYYVVHRALGYLYYEKAKAIKVKIDEAPNDKTPATQLNASYISMVKTALPHLEKAQACDPSDETLALIKMLYKSINDDGDLNSLDSRLKALGAHCSDILNDR